jgi:hypothetical protein
MIRSSDPDDLSVSHSIDERILIASRLDIMPSDKPFATAIPEYVSIINLELRVMHLETPATWPHAIPGRRTKNDRERTEYAPTGIHSFATRMSRWLFGWPITNHAISRDTSDGERPRPPAAGWVCGGKMPARFGYR